MTKIVFDFSGCSNLFWGTSKYCIRLLKGLYGRDDCDLTLLSIPSQNDIIDQLFPGFNKIQIDAASGLVGRVSYECQRYKALKKMNPDILIQPTLGIFHVNPKKVFVAQTIHDLQVIKLPGGGG